MPLLGSGRNILPVMHVADLATYVAAVCIEPPEQQYLLAVDSATLTQQDLVTGQPFQWPCYALQSTHLPGCNVCTINLTPAGAF